MLEIQPFYRIHDLHPNAAGYFPSSPQTAVCVYRLKFKLWPIKVNIYIFTILEFKRFKKCIRFRSGNPVEYDS